MYKLSSTLAGPWYYENGMPQPPMPEPKAWRAIGRSGRGGRLVNFLPTPHWPSHKGRHLKSRATGPFKEPKAKNLLSDELNNMCQRLTVVLWNLCRRWITLENHLWKQQTCSRSQLTKEAPFTTKYSATRVKKPGGNKHLCPNQAVCCTDCTLRQKMLALGITVFFWRFRWRCTCRCCPLPGSKADCTLWAYAPIANWGPLGNGVRMMTRFAANKRWRTRGSYRGS